MPTRRTLLATSLAAGIGTSLWTSIPRAALAQGTPIRLAALLPLTGAGGSYGPSMAKAAQAVVDQVNGVGGLGGNLGGRRIELIVTDDQTNPDAAVRAARQLIDVQKVSAILGTWASAVTTAVAPLCWESKTFLTTTSGAESITALPHDGYLVRTQPTTSLQGTKFGQFALQIGAKKVYFMTPQTPFAQSEGDAIAAVVNQAGGTYGTLVYDADKPSYRSEVDTALRAQPDAIILGGYTPDTIVLLKDLYRAGFKGARIGFAYAINQKLIGSVPLPSVEGAYTLAPSSSEASHAFQDLVKLTGLEHPDPYTAQLYDQTNLVLLAMAQAGEASGTAIRDTIRKVSQAPDGTVVENAPDGLKLIAAKQPIAYQGASGPCKFTPKGDIVDSKFRYEQVKDGKIVLLSIV